MTDQMNRAHIVAAHDISEYVKSLNQPIVTDKYDVWFCLEKHLMTKEQRELNRKLGINRVNYTKNNMIRYNSKYKTK